MTAACMGGFCSKREHCGRHQQEDRRVVVERLCERGQEQPQDTSAGVWVRRGGWVELMTAEGAARAFEPMTPKPVVDALWPGFRCIRCARSAQREGSGRRHYAGFQQLVCAKCKDEIDRRRAR